MTFTCVTHKKWRIFPSEWWWRDPEYLPDFWVRPLELGPPSSKLLLRCISSLCVPESVSLKQLSIPSDDWLLFAFGNFVTVTCTWKINEKEKKMFLSLLKQNSRVWSDFTSPLSEFISNWQLSKENQIWWKGNWKKKKKETFCWAK